jgi:serine phosphatase RsbU (regulator of sigma subunit)
MTAALLLGAAERHDADSPSQLLMHLNRVLAASGIGGFATCLCADIAPGGAVMLANAGHLPPWCDGEEMPSPSSLPLGLSQDEHYLETRLDLAPGDTLTLLSDGVVEARNTRGELFGFERTREPIGRAPSQIAQAAQAYGQNDDITVLSITRLPVRASTAPLAPTSALS